MRTSRATAAGVELLASSAHGGVEIELASRARSADEIEMLTSGICGGSRG
jgi:hypothetical protein